MARDKSPAPLPEDRPGPGPEPTGVVPAELPLKAPDHSAERVTLDELPPEATSSAAPPASADVIPPELLPQGPGGVIRDTGPDGDREPPEVDPSTRGDRRRYAEELAEQRRLAEAGDPAADPDRLHELHYLVNGQEPPPK